MALDFRNDWVYTTFAMKKKTSNFNVRATPQERDLIKSLAYDLKLDQSKVTWFAIRFAKDNLYEFLTFVKLHAKK